MDYKKIGAAGVLLSILLSGCGTQAAQTQDAAKQGSTAQGAAAQDTAKQDSAQAKSNKPAQMNEQERQMMMTFQELVMMDKADGLAITKEQAEPMLTVVQDSITKGELTSDAQTKLNEKLTADQKKYLDDAAAKMKERMENMKQGQGGPRNGNGNGQKPGQNQASAQGTADASKPADANGSAGAAASSGGQQAQTGQGQAGQGQSGTGDASGKGGQERGSRGGGNGGNGGFGGGRNAGQQLVELLQSKLK